MENRSGVLRQQSQGYKAFIPEKLPPNPPLEYDDETQKLLSNADRRIGRLDGVTQTLPNSALFVAMYVKKEALLSSQIEGTQASFVDVLNADEETSNENIGEVVNYVAAMNHGLNRLKEFPMSLRLIREIHGKLLQHGRGSQRMPGEFRTSQNWIGSAGSTLQTASFVPPPVPDMMQALGDLELFMHAEDKIPPLIKIGLIHAQFETIHPFLDGNGRMGRLLITFWLCQQEILSEPLLYLSVYFKLNRLEYYDRLMNVRLKGDWEGWIKFFLKGICEVSDEAITTAKQINMLREACHKKLLSSGIIGNKHGFSLLDLLFQYPITTIQNVKTQLNVSLPTATAAVDHLVHLNILQDFTPTKKRMKRFGFSDYIKILERDT